MVEAPSPEDRAELKQRFEERIGHWRDAYEPILEHDPEFFQIFTELAWVPHGTDVLTDRTKALVSLAASSQITHLDRDAMRVYIRQALDAGGDPEDVLAVLQLSSVIGFHSVTRGLPLLAETYDPPSLTDEEAALYETVLQRYDDQDLEWDESGRTMTVPGLGIYRLALQRTPWADLADYDPVFFDAMMAYSEHPMDSIEPKTREFIWIAIDVVAGHVHPQGLDVHFRTAKQCGATVEEVMAVIELASLIQFDTMTVGVDLLLAEAEGFDG
jgi:alkylhydroperoxidase/carboxymuconolactone decarboxylase family protein YurZ